MDGWFRQARRLVAGQVRDWTPGRVEQLAAASGTIVRWIRCLGTRRGWVTCRDDGVLQFWTDDFSRNQMTVATRGDGCVVALDVESDRVATAGPAGTIDLWNPTTGALLRSIACVEPASKTPCMGYLTGLAFLPGGRILVSCDTKGRGVRFWSVDRGIALDEIDLSPISDHPSALAVSPDGQAILVGTERGNILKFARTRAE